MIFCVMAHMEALARKINLNKDILEYVGKKLKQLPCIREEDVECMCITHVPPHDQGMLSGTQLNFWCFTVMPM